MIPRGIRGPVGNERGGILVLTAVMLSALLGMAAFGVDVAMLYSARAEAQRAADAAALAGASAFVDVSSASQVQVAQQRAISYAAENRIRGVPIVPAEVTVTVLPEQVRVRVVVNRPQVSTFFAQVLGIRFVRVTASATAQATEVPEQLCVKPWAAPEPTPGSRSAPFPLGERIVVKGATSLGEAHPWVLGNPTSSGPCSGNGSHHNGPAYSTNICNCNRVQVDFNGTYSLVAGSPGTIRPHTDNGVRDLVAQDPGAWWDARTQSVVGSTQRWWRDSPRVAHVALYDQTTNGNRLHFSRLMPVFVESTSNGTVYARYIGPLRQLQLVW